jgi:hypothetical protein
MAAMLGRTLGKDPAVILGDRGVVGSRRKQANRIAPRESQCRQDRSRPPGPNSGSHNPRRSDVWGGLDSNQRPTDYESGNREGADLQEFLNVLVRGIT